MQGGSTDDFIDDGNGFDDDGNENNFNDFPAEDDASDVENEVVIEANELENDSESDDDTQMQSDHESASNDCFYGRDGTKWMKNEPPNAGRLRHHNVMRFRSGPKVQNALPMDVLKKFFSQNI